MFKKHNNIYCSITASHRQLAAYCSPLMKVTPTRLRLRHRWAGGWPWAGSSWRREVGAVPARHPLWFVECALCPLSLFPLWAAPFYPLSQFHGKVLTRHCTDGQRMQQGLPCKCSAGQEWFSDCKNILLNHSPPSSLLQGCVLTAVFSL